MSLIEPVETARTLLDRLGVEGVSAVTVLVLLGIYLYARRASRWGRAAVYRAGNAGEHVQVATLLLLVLLLLGVLSADLDRARELIQTGVRMLPTEVLPWG